MVYLLAYSPRVRSIMGSKLHSGQSKDFIKLAFVAFLLCMLDKRLRANTGWPGMVIICPSGAKCLPQTVVSLSKYYKNQTQRVGQVQRGHHHHLIEM